MRRRIFLPVATASLLLAPVVFAQPLDCATPLPGAVTFPRVLHQAPPPQAAARARQPWPGSDYATTDVKRLVASDPSVPSYFFLWVNRCQGGSRDGECGANPKGNPPEVRVGSGREVRFFFNSRAAADACTLTQLGRLLGRDEGGLAARARATGLTVVDAPEAIRASGNGEAVNTCLVSSERLPSHVGGVMIDFEAQDNRSPQATGDLLREITNMARSAGKRVVLYTNPHDGGGVKRSGLTPQVINSMANSFELVSVLPEKRRGGSATDSLRNQRAMLSSVPSSKLMLVYDLTSFSQPETRQLRQAALDLGITTTMIWRNGTPYGDSCAAPGVAKMACLALGNCR